MVATTAAPSRDGAKRGLFSNVGGFHKRRRLNSALDCRTLDQAERQAANAT